MPLKTFFGPLLALLALCVALGCQSEPQRCAICHMPIPDETRALIRVEGGTPKHVCDARCPLTYQHDTGQKVQLLRVTDYASGARLKPEDAVYVTGSDIAPDAHTQAIRTTPADTAYLHWHRCLPSVLAFRSQAEAVQFQDAHGGKVMKFDELGFTGG